MAPQKTAPKKYKRPVGATAETENPHIHEHLRAHAIDIRHLVMDARNPQLHPQQNVDAIVASMRRFGQDQLVLYRIEDRQVIAGHGRLIAARQLGWKTVAAIGRPDSEIEAAARAIADNRTNQLARQDERLLGLMMKDINEGEAALIQATGYDAGAVERLIEGVREAEAGPDDNAGNLPANPTTKLGDVWALGDHRLVCGDATNADTVALLMDGERAHMVHTDPPYGVAYQGRGPQQVIDGDHLTGDALVDQLLGPALTNAAASAADDAAFYVWHSENALAEFDRACEVAGLDRMSRIIWAKPAPARNWLHYRMAHEPCIYACKRGCSPRWFGGHGEFSVWRFGFRMGDTVPMVLGKGVHVVAGNDQLYVMPRPPAGKKPRQSVRLNEGQVLQLSGSTAEDTVWEIGRETGTIHPNQKPIDLCRRAIQNSSRPGDIVLDLFGGSGSTLMAADVMGRRCFTMERHAGYCDLIIKRWERARNAKAERVHRAK